MLPAAMHLASARVQQLGSLCIRLPTCLHPTFPRPAQGNANRFPDPATCKAAAAQYCTGRSDRLALQLASAGPADTSLTAGAAGSDQPTEAPAAGTETAAPAKSASPATHAGRSLFAWAALAAMFHLV